MNLNGKASDIVFYITAGLVIVLFATAFILSYEALRNLASDNGVTGWRSLLWPLGLDAFMAVASLYMLWAHLNRTWEQLPLALVMVAMGASVVFNVVHAPGTSLARAVAALPPLVAFMAFEVFIIMVREITQRDMLRNTLAQLEQQRDTLLAEIEQEQATLGTLRDKARSARGRLKDIEEQRREHERSLEAIEAAGGDPIVARREQLRLYLEQHKNGDEPTQVELAEHFNVSRGTIRRDLAAIGKL